MNCVPETDYNFTSTNPFSIKIKNLLHFYTDTLVVICYDPLNLFLGPYYLVVIAKFSKRFCSFQESPENPNKAMDNPIFVIKLISSVKKKIF